MENEENLELEPEKIEETGEAKAEEAKPKLTPEQELGIKKRTFTRLAKELGVELPKKQEPAKEPERVKSEFSDTEMLFLDVKNVPDEDRTWLFEEHRTTGKPIRQLYGLQYIQEGLRTRLQSRASEQAIPSGNNRAGVVTKNDPDYWLAKIDAGQATLMQVPTRELRSKIVQMRIAREGEHQKFTDNPLV